MDGMKAVATTIMNRVHVAYGEYLKNRSGRSAACADAAGAVYLLYDGGVRRAKSADGVEQSTRADTL